MHCECLAGDDAFIGYSWFNGPYDAEAFAYNAVLEEFWMHGGTRRSRLAQLMHERRAAHMLANAFVAPIFEATGRAEL